MKKQSKKDDAPLRYEAAFAELRQIVERMQDDEVSVDDLIALTARANELIEWCRERLRTVEAALSDHHKSGLL